MMSSKIALHKEPLGTNVWLKLTHNFMPSRTPATDWEVINFSRQSENQLYVTSRFTFIRRNLFAPPNKSATVEQPKFHWRCTNGNKNRKHWQAESIGRNPDVTWMLSISGDSVFISDSKQTQSFDFWLLHNGTWTYIWCLQETLWKRPFIQIWSRMVRFQNIQEQNTADSGNST